MIAGLLIAALAVAQEPVAEGVRVEHAATGASLAVDVARPASAGGVGERAVARLPGRVPLVAHGDRVRWDLATGQVELTGDVRIERGELVLLCQHLVLDWEGEALTRAVASGALQAHLGERSATATEASLDPEAGLIVLTGAPRLQWGDRVLEGDRIALALEDERVDCDHCRLVLEDPLVILEGRGIVVRLGGRAVVDGVDLGVGAGEVVGLFGPNGAGKSTLFRALVGAIRPDAGRVTWRDEDVTAWPLHRRARAGVGYLAQRPSVIGGLSVRHNVALPTTATASSIAEALRVCGVEALADRDAGTLSGGERRRVELARCVASGARVVLLDEPFSGVDPARVGALVELIRALAARDVGVLFTDHAARDALPICDRVVVLDEGKARVSGTMEAVSRDPWVLEAYLGRHRSDRDADSRW